MSRRVRYKPGDIYEIEHEGRAIAYALALTNDAGFSFFRNESGLPVPLEEIVSLPVAFTVPCHVDQFEKGRWKKVGREIRPEYFDFIVKYRMSERMTPYPRLYYNDPNAPGGFVERRATREEVEGLEVLAVWEAEHILDRLTNPNAIEWMRKDGLA